MEGDCILYGDTTGELYRSRHDKSMTSDIFVAKLSQVDGSYSQTLEMRRGHFAAIGIGILVSFACLGFCFCAVGGRWFRRRHSPIKKNDDFDLNDGVFRDDPSSDSRAQSNGYGRYMDDAEGNVNGSGGIFELPMKSSKAYQD
jgi:hypothetical protein